MVGRGIMTKRTENGQRPGANRCPRTYLPSWTFARLQSTHFMPPTNLDALMGEITVSTSGAVTRTASRDRMCFGVDHQPPLSETVLPPSPGREGLERPLVRSAEGSGADTLPWPRRSCPVASVISTTPGTLMSFAGRVRDDRSRGRRPLQLLNKNGRKAYETGRRR